MSTKSITTRLDEELLDKFRIVAAYDGRSMNKQLQMLIRKQVALFESQHGRIPLPSRQTSTP